MTMFSYGSKHPRLLSIRVALNRPGSPTFGSVMPQLIFSNSSG